MWKYAVVVLAAAAALGPATAGLGPAGAALGPAGAALARAWLPLALSIGLAVAVSARLDVVAVVAGALGGLALGAAGPAGLAAGSHGAAGVLAGAALATAAYAERTTRIAGAGTRLGHLLLATVTGSFGYWLTARYQADPVLHATAAGLGGFLMAAPLLLPADDHIAHLLELAAHRLDGAAAAPLRSAVELRRWSRRPLCPHPTDRPVNKRWGELADRAKQRAALPTAPATTLSPAGYREGAGAPDARLDATVARDLDERIAACVDWLLRAYKQAPSR
jgi:hypothetical protein